MIFPVSTGFVWNSYTGWYPHIQCFSIVSPSLYIWKWNRWYTLFSEHQTIILVVIYPICLDRWIADDISCINWVCLKLLYWYPHIQCFSIVSPSLYIWKWNRWYTLFSEHQTTILLVIYPIPYHLYPLYIHVLIVKSPYPRIQAQG